MGTGVLSRYGVVSDEIADDPATAFAVAAEWGMEAVDLNSVWDKQITDLDDGEVRRLRELLLRFGLHAFMVAGLPFKALVVPEGMRPQELLRSSAFEVDMAILHRSLEIAQALGAACVRVHAFAWPPLPPGASARRPDGGEIPSAVLGVIAAGLRAAAALLDRYPGVFLGMENVRASYGNCGRNLQAVLEAVGDPRLRVVWDPANAYVSGEDRPYPDGFLAVRTAIAHVHVKDARLTDPRTGATAWARVGDGAVDWVGQLRALAADGYGGLLCLETHWSPPGASGREASAQALQGLRLARERALGRGQTP